MAGTRDLGLRKLALDIGLTVGRQAIVIGLGLALTVLLARLLGPSGNGQYAVAVLLPTMLVSFLNLGISAANVYFIGRGDVSVRGALKTTLSLWTWVSLGGVGIAALVIVTQREAWFPGVPSPLLWLALACFPLTLLHALLSGLLQATQDFRRYNKMMVGAPAAILILAVITVWVLDWGVFGALVALLLGSLGGLGAATMALRPHLTDNTDLPRENYARRLLGYGWKVHIGNILTFLNYRADIFLLNLLLNPAAVGVYVIAVQLAERVWILSSAVSTVLLPRLAELHNEDDKRRVLTPLIARWVFLVSGAGAIVLVGIASPFIRFLFGPDYSEATNALLWLLPGIVLGSLARILANDLAARGKPELNLYTAIFVVAINLTGNVLLIPRMGIVGAAVATTIAYVGNACIKMVLYTRVSGNPMHELIAAQSSDWLMAKRVAFTLIRAGR